MVIRVKVITEKVTTQVRVITDVLVVAQEVIRDLPQNLVINATTLV